MIKVISSYLHFFVILFFLVFSNQSHALSDEKRIFAKLIVSNDTQAAKLGAKIVHQEAMKDTDILDLIASSVHHRMDTTEILHGYTDLIAWQGKALAASGFTRYTPTLEKMANHSRDPKIAKYGNNLLPDLYDDAQPKFIYSEAKFIAEKETLSQPFSNSIFSEKAYLSLKLGQKLDEVIDQVGLPDAVYGKPSAPVAIRAVAFGKIRINKTALVLSYKNYGELYFMAHDGDWISTIVSNVYALTQEVENPDEKRLIEVLLSDDWLNMRRDIASAGRRQQSQRVYDIAAERLMQSKNTSANSEVEMLAHLARLLGNSGDSRYISALETTLQSTRFSALKRHCKKALKQLKKKGENKGSEPYQQGMINIGHFNAH